MLSVHTTRFNGENDGAYARGWCVPSSSNFVERGAFNTPVPSATMRDIAVLIKEYVWSPIIWEKGRRLEKNYKSAQILALDFDDGKTNLGQAIKYFANCTCLIGTTRSHTAMNHRFRVLLQFQEPITDFKQFNQNMVHFIRQYGTDKSCADGAQYYYPCKEIVYLNDVGQLINVTPYIEPEAKVTKPKLSKSKAVFSKRVVKLFKNGLFGSAKERGERGEIDPPSRDYESFYAAREMLAKGYDEETIFCQISSCTDLSDREIRQKIESAKRHLQKI